MDKGCQTMRIKADTPMREIKKVFPKHLSATEDTFMLYFNKREVQNETPLQLMGDNLEGDHNVIEIVKTIKIKLAGKHFLLWKSHYLDISPKTQFGEIRERIAAFLKEPQALITLFYNGQEIVNCQTPRSVKMGHGDVLKVIKKDQIAICLGGSLFDYQSHYIDIDPHTTTMLDIKKMISLQKGEDPRKIMLCFKGQEPSDQDT